MLAWERLFSYCLKALTTRKALQTKAQSLRHFYLAASTFKAKCMRFCKSFIDLFIELSIISHKKLFLMLYHFYKCDDLKSKLTQIKAILLMSFQTIIGKAFSWKQKIFRVITKFLFFLAKLESWNPFFKDNYCYLL